MNSGRIAKRTTPRNFGFDALDGVTLDKPEFFLEMFACDLLACPESEFREILAVLGQDLRQTPYKIEQCQYPGRTSIVFRFYKDS